MIWTVADKRWMNLLNLIYTSFITPHLLHLINYYLVIKAEGSQPEGSCAEMRDLIYRALLSDIITSCLRKSIVPYIHTHIIDSICIISYQVEQ